MVIDVKLLNKKASDSMLITEDGIVMELNPVTSRKALAPMLVTEDGMVMELNPVTSRKALAPMLVTEDEIVIDVTPVAYWNALSPMLVYVSICTLVAPYNNAVAPDNAPLPLNILVIHDTVIPDFPYNILVPGVLLRPSRSVDSSKTALVNPELENAFSPMLLTDDGMVTDVRPVAPWKALAPMLLTDDGMETDVRPVASWKALAPILATVFGIVYDVRVLPIGYWIINVLSLLNNAPLLSDE